MIIIGMDPGARGAAVALLNEFVFVWAFDGLLTSLRSWIGESHAPLVAEPVHAYIEQGHSMPKQGVASSFKFGQRLGELVGLCVGLGLPYTLVPPHVWQREMHAGIGKDIPPKQRSLMAFERLFPNEMPRVILPGCRKPHDGLIDAWLIAEYGRRKQGVVT